MWSLGGLSIRELVRRAVNGTLCNDCLGRAAQLAYYFLFALFPFLLFLATLLGYIPVPNVFESVMDLLARWLPTEALTLIRDNLRSLVSQQNGGLLSFSILAALWTASSAIVAITQGVNHAYKVEESRPWWKVRGIALLTTLGFSLFITVAMILLIFGPQLGGWIAQAVGLGDLFTVAWNVLRWVVIVALLMVALALLYYFVPDVQQQWRWMTPGSLFAVLGWITASLGFSYYVNNFGSYNATYGSIGAVIVLLTWMYVSGFFILLGGEINAEIERASQRRGSQEER